MYVLLYSFCLGGRFNRGFFCVTSLGGLYLEGLLHGGAYFQNVTVFYGVVWNVLIKKHPIIAAL